MAKTSDRDSPPLSRDASTMPWIVAGMAAVVAAIYLMLFLSMSVGGAGSALSRFQLYLTLLAPDDVVRSAVGDFAWQGVWDRMRAIGGAALAIWCATWLGWWPLKWLGAGENRPTWEQGLLAAGLGLHLVSLLTLLIGLAGWLQTPLIFAFLVAAGTAPPLIALFLFARAVWKNPLPPKEAGSRSEPGEGPGASPIERRWWFGGIAVAALFVAIILLGAALPPWDFDVLEYHLQVPKEWYQAGRIEFLPHNMYANMPLDAEMLPLAAMSVLADWWWGAIVGKTLMGACAILTAIAIYGLVRRLTSPLPALIAAILWLSHPWVIHVSISGLNEQVYALYLALAVSVVAVPDASWRNWLLAGFFAGATAACKYPAVVMFVLPLAFWAAFAPRFVAPRTSSLRLRATALAGFVIAAALGGGAWYVKNWVQAGNPVYPLLGTILDGKTRTPEKNEQFARGHAVPPFTPGKLAESLARIGWQSEHQGPLLVPLAMLGAAALAVAIGHRPFVAGTLRAPSINNGTQSAPAIHWPAAIGILWLLAFFIASWWLFTHRLDRFLVPAIPLAAVLAGIGIEYALQRPLKWVLYPLLAAGLLYNLAYVCWPMPMAAVVMAGDNRWLVSLAELRAGEPRGPSDLSRVNQDIRWLNDNVPPGQAMLCVGEAAVFDLKMPVYYNTCFDDCLLVKWMSGRSASERKQLFHDKQIAFVYVDWGEIARYQAPGNYGYDPRFSRALLDELVQQQVLAPPLARVPPEVYPVLP